MSFRITGLPTEEFARLFALSDKELDSIGRRVWQNACGGTREGLTSWNSGENFASPGGVVPERHQSGSGRLQETKGQTGALARLG